MNETANERTTTMDKTNDEMWSWHATLTDDRIAHLLKAISRLDRNGREQLSGVTDALEKLEPDQRLIIRRYSAEADAKRLAEHRERVERERAQRRLEREAKTVSKP
jgi:hypothetical protein